MPVLELIAKIFGAVSRTKAKCGSRCCLHASDAVAAMTAFVRMKNKEKPLDCNPNVHFVHELWSSGFNTVIRQIGD